MALTQNILIITVSELASKEQDHSLRIDRISRSRRLQDSGVNNQNCDLSGIRHYLHLEIPTPMSSPPRRLLHSSILVPPGFGQRHSAATSAKFREILPGH